MPYEHGQHATRAMADLIKKQTVGSVKDTSPRGFLPKGKKKKKKTNSKK